MAATRLTVSFVTLFVAMLALGVSTPVKPAAAQNSGWWGCPDGYQFEVQPGNSRMRCIKREEVRYRAVSCPSAGQGPAPRVVQDKSGTKDACVVGNSPYTAPPVCPRGYASETRTGLDRCTIRVPSVVRPPIQQ